MAPHHNVIIAIIHSKYKSKVYKIPKAQQWVLFWSRKRHVLSAFLVISVLAPKDVFIVSCES